ncbi:hypothetical protein BGZ96_002974 [Linnemannia gamsii]|uniref:Aminotransferase class I/classII large domain-containing protein n=1 Tax=Linnemannia gamsii TaxID=64522 RepID=A0ABQ7KIH1_9FUNG|nr:hypothetical protein BGZ96_002974 [Linnemannia gamsii]
MAREKLEKIRASDTENGILVVTESLFSMDSDSPDLKALQELAHEFNATLVVDVAHDLGSLGENGRGHIELQNMIGKIDVIMGSFSKTFASSGGFVASNQRSVKEYLRYFSSPNIGSNALSPSQAAIVGKCFDIAASDEGAALRRKLMNNAMQLRQLLHDSDFDTYGEPSPIVSVKIATEGLARLVSRHLPPIGLLSNLVEFPAVAKGAARFRFQVMANHTNKDITDGADFFKMAMAMARTEDETLQSGAIELAELTKSKGTQLETS